MLLRVKEYLEKEPNRAFWIYGIRAEDYESKSEIIRLAFPGLKCEHMPASAIAKTDFIKISRV
jgi:hypothetical protein